MDNVCQPVDKNRFYVVILRSDAAKKAEERFRTENGVIKDIYKTYLTLSSLLSSI